MSKFAIMMTKITITSIICMFCFAAIAVEAQTYAPVMAFTSSNAGATIPTGLTQAPNGNLAGVTEVGGTHIFGTAYQITPAGRELGSYNFCSLADCADGEEPYGQLLLASDGNLYGSTTGGGNSVGGGTIFKITPEGQLTTIYDFCSLANCADGYNVAAPLVEGRNGNLYGATRYGGSGKHCVFNVGGCGTIFELTTSGVLTTLYDLCSKPACSDGYSPFLTLGTDGNLYGVTSGAFSNYDTFFRLTPSGYFDILHEFNGATDGFDPQGIIEGSDGNFYGTTAIGGANGGGTVFQIVPPGTLTTLHAFCIDSSCSDGYKPQAGLIQASDGNFYGTTQQGGTTDSNSGTIFQITSAGVLTTLHSFCSEANCADGALPDATVTQDTNGTFYGTTVMGGDKSCNYCGMVYSLSTGLTPFVQPTPAFAKVGFTVMILGNNLTGATSVTFNGLPATSFSVKSPTLIEATVPSGATSGAIEVTTPTGALSSSVAFQILP
jgi:uncharacterized repeat protein (TIGR03803 family)